MLEDTLYRYLANKLGAFIRGGLDREHVQIALGQRGYFVVHDLELETRFVEDYWRRELGIKELCIRRAELGTLSIQARWNGVISVTIADVYLAFSWHPAAAAAAPPDVDRLRSIRKDVLAQDEQKRQRNREAWAKALFAEHQTSAAPVQAGYLPTTPEASVSHETGWFRSFAGRATAFLLRRLQLQIERVHIQVNFGFITPEIATRNENRSPQMTISSWGIMLRQLTLMDRAEQSDLTVTGQTHPSEWRASAFGPVDTDKDAAGERHLILDRQLRIIGLACYLQPAVGQDVESRLDEDEDLKAPDGTRRARFDRFETSIVPYLICCPSDGLVSFRIERRTQSPDNHFQTAESSQREQSGNEMTSVHLHFAIERWHLQLSQSQWQTVAFAMDYATWWGWRQRSEMMLRMHTPEPYLQLFANRYRNIFSATSSTSMLPLSGASAQLREERTARGHRVANERLSWRWRYVLHCIRALVASRRRPFGLEGVSEWSQRKALYLELYWQRNVRGQPRLWPVASSSSTLAASETVDDARMLALEQQLSLEEILYFRSLTDQRYWNVLKSNLDTFFAAASTEGPSWSGDRHILPDAFSITKAAGYRPAQTPGTEIGVAKGAAVPSSSTPATTGWLGWLSSALGWGAPAISSQTATPRATAHETQSPADEMAREASEAEPTPIPTEYSPSVRIPIAADGQRMQTEQEREKVPSETPTSTTAASLASASVPSHTAEGDTETEQLTRALGERFQTFVQDHEDDDLTKLEQSLHLVQFEPEAAGLVIEFHVVDTQLKLLHAGALCFAETRLQRLVIRLERAPGTTRLLMQTGDICAQASEPGDAARYRVIFVDSSADSPDEPLIQLVYEHRQSPGSNGMHALSSWSRNLASWAEQWPRRSNRLSIRGKPLILVLTPPLFQQLRAFGQRQALPWQAWIEEAKAQFTAYRTAVVAALPDSQAVADAAASLELDIIVFAPRIYLLSRLSASQELLRAQNVREHVLWPKRSTKLYWSRLIRRVIRANRLEAYALHIQLGRLAISSTSESVNQAASTLMEVDRAQHRLGLVHRQDEANRQASREVTERQLQARWEPLLTYDLSVQQMSVALECTSDASALIGQSKIPILVPCGGRARLVLARQTPMTQNTPIVDATPDSVPSNLPTTKSSLRLVCLTDISTIELHITPALWQYILRWRAYWTERTERLPADSVSEAKFTSSGTPADSALNLKAFDPTFADATRAEKRDGTSAVDAIDAPPSFGTPLNRSGYLHLMGLPQMPFLRSSILSIVPMTDMNLEMLLLELHCKGADATLQLWSPTDPPAQLTIVSAGLDAALGLCYRLGATSSHRLSFANHAPQLQVRQQIAGQDPVVLLSPIALRSYLHVQYQAATTAAASAIILLCGLCPSAFDGILRRQDLDLWQRWIQQWSSAWHAKAATAAASEAPPETIASAKAMGQVSPSASVHLRAPASASPGTDDAFKSQTEQKRSEQPSSHLWSALWPSSVTESIASVLRREPSDEQARKSRPCLHSAACSGKPATSNRSASLANSMSPQLNTLMTLWDSATQLPCVLQWDPALSAYVLVLSSSESTPASDAALMCPSFLVQRVDPDDETIFFLQPCGQSDETTQETRLSALGTLTRLGIDRVALAKEDLENPRSSHRSAEPENESPAGNRLPSVSEQLAVLGSSWRPGTPLPGAVLEASTDTRILCEPLVWRACLVTPDGFCLMNARTGSFLGWNARGQAILTNQPETVLRLGSPGLAYTGSPVRSVVPDASSGNATTPRVSVAFRLSSPGALLRLVDESPTVNGCLLPFVAFTLSQIECGWQSNDDVQELETQCSLALDAYDAGLDAYQPRLFPCRLQLRMQRQAASGLVRIWLNPLYREPIRFQGSEEDLLELLLLWEYFSGRRATLPSTCRRAYRFTNETDADLVVTWRERGPCTAAESASQKVAGPSSLPTGPDAIQTSARTGHIAAEKVAGPSSLPTGPDAIQTSARTRHIAADTAKVSLAVPPSWVPHSLWRIGTDHWGRFHINRTSSQERQLLLGLLLAALPGSGTKWFQWSLDRDTPISLANDEGAGRSDHILENASCKSSTQDSVDALLSEQCRQKVLTTLAEPELGQDEPPVGGQLVAGPAPWADASASASLWKRVHWQVTQSRVGWEFCLQAPVAVHNACSQTTLRIRCLGHTLVTADHAHIDHIRMIAPQSSLHLGAMVDLRALTVSFVDGSDTETSPATEWCESFSVQAEAMLELYGESVCIAHMVHWSDSRALRVARHVYDDGTIHVWLSPILEFRNLLPVPALVTIHEHIVLLEPRSRQELFRFPADGSCELAVSVGEVLLERRQFVTRFQLSDREHVESLARAQSATKVALFSQLLDTPQGFVEASCYLGLAARNALILLSPLYTVFNMVPGMSIQVQESGQVPEHERLPPRSLLVKPFQAAFLRTPCCRLYGWREPVRLDLVTAQGYFLRLQGIPLVLSFATSYEEEQLERSRWYNDIEGSVSNWISGTEQAVAKAGAARAFAIRPELVLINELDDTELLVRRAFPSSPAAAEPVLVLNPVSMQPFLFPVYAARDFAGNAVAREKAPADSAALHIQIARRLVTRPGSRDTRSRSEMAADVRDPLTQSDTVRQQTSVSDLKEQPHWSGVLPLAVTGSFVIDVADGLPGMLTVTALLEQGGCQVVRFQATSTDAIPFQLVNGTPELLCFVQANNRDQALALLNNHSHRIHWAPPNGQVAFAFCEPLEKRTLCVIRMDMDPPACYLLPELEAAFLDAPDETVLNARAEAREPDASSSEPEQRAWRRCLVAEASAQTPRPPALWVSMQATPTYRLLEFFTDESESNVVEQVSEQAARKTERRGLTNDTRTLSSNWVRRLHLFALVPELVVDLHATAEAGGVRAQLCLRDLQIATDLDLETNARHHLQLSLQNVQLRNESPDTLFPIVIRSGAFEDDADAKSSEAMALEAELVLRRRFGELECAPLRVMIAPVILHLEAHFLAQAAAWTTAISQEWAIVHQTAAGRHHDWHTASMNVIEQPNSIVWMPEPHGGPRLNGANRRGLTWVVLAYLRLTPVEIRLSFHRGKLPRTPDVLTDASVLARVAYLSTRERMSTMPSIDQASLQLAGLELRRHSLTSPDELFILVWSRWTRSILNQWYKLLGSLDVIGAPLAASRSPVTQLREMYSSLMAGRSTARRFSYGAYSAVSAAERVSIDAGQRAAQPAAQALAKTAGALGLRLLARGLKRLGSGPERAARGRDRNLGNSTDRSKVTTERSAIANTLSTPEPVEAITATMDDLSVTLESEPLIQWDDSDDEIGPLATDFVLQGTDSPAGSIDLRQMLLYSWK
jgi:hypothetical protein